MAASGNPLTASETLALAVLRATPGGVADAQELANRSRGRLDSATAAVMLRRLVAAGFADQAWRNVVDGSKTVRKLFTRCAAKAYGFSGLVDAINSCHISITSLVHLDRTDRVPERFAHYFWNTDPDKLDLQVNGAQIAVQLAEMHDPEALQWALANIEPTQLCKAASTRGMHPGIANILKAAATW